MKRELTVGARIWLVVGLCLGIGGGAITFLLKTLSSTSSGYELSMQEYQQRVREQDSARVMQVTFKKEVQEWKDILLRGHNPDDLAKYSSQFRAASAKVADIGEAFKAALSDSAMLRHIDDFLEAHAALQVKYGEALRLFVEAKGANPHEADALVKGQDRSPTDLIDKLVGASVERASAKVASEHEAVANAIRVTAIAVLIAFLLTGFAAALTIRKISAALRLAVRNLTEGATQVAEAASEVAKVSQSLAQGASEQAASIEETSAASEQINSMARANTSHSTEATGLLSQSQAKFGDANRKLDQMVEAMAEINEQSDKIRRIIKVIEEIAFQTNILALNAAVEAARAGEAGMGFAVVADEVRNLAQRSAQAARDTSSLIEESIARSGNGKVRVDQVADVIREITGEIGKVTTLVEEVNQGSRDQAKGIEQVARAIAGMEQVTQQSTASTEESASAAEELSAQSENLQQVARRLAAMVGHK